jgi:hypothetical protein
MAVRVVKHKNQRLRIQHKASSASAQLVLSRPFRPCPASLRSAAARLPISPDLRSPNPDPQCLLQSPGLSQLPEPTPGAWPAPLPDLSQPAIQQRVRIGHYVFHVAISSVQRDVPREPETHLVQIVVEYGDRPLTAYDLGLRPPDACANVWAYLTNRVNETVVQFYSPRPRDTGELNPRLGCWGPRPDLRDDGFAESDCAIAVVLGLSIWIPGSKPPVDDQIFLEALRDTIVEALSYWVVVAQRTAGPQDRRN